MGGLLEVRHMSLGFLEAMVGFGIFVNVWVELNLILRFSVNFDCSGGLGNAFLIGIV